MLPLLRLFSKDFGLVGETAKEYAQIYWRSHSLSEEDKHILNKRLIFLDSKLSDSDKFKPLTRLKYEQDRMKQRQAERWIENLMNAAIDISKIILASQKRPIPSTHMEILKGIDTIAGFPEGAGEQLAKWTELRNILAHEYLDVRWKRIDDFIKRSEPYFRKLTEAVKSNFLSEKEKQWAENEKCGRFPYSAIKSNFRLQMLNA